MNKFKVTIQPIDGPEVSFKVGGFDREDAKRQGLSRWVWENNRSLAEIAEVFVEPLTEESESQREARLLGRTG